MHVVLVQPQIPQNTGSIARTCAATCTPLHIIHPIPFEISERTVRRAGLDYWPYVNLIQYASFEQYIAQQKPKRYWAISKFGTVPYFKAQFSLPDALVFGSETKGLGKEFLDRCAPESILRIPMDCQEVRSLNLSNAASIVLYEARRQLHEQGVLNL